ncbi:hypothetical protein BJL95_19480 [Methylomonas sp. LWB]|uniref:roadblock/LC7 domain-containing protein n=1 Tax=Methylomonas sp. LWB TaxID=1905845 RepID=UPI0008DA8FB4|nr:roadblock/LC7 domain-containing protein [Methylomonas sp. LWB]OHX36886.1 hypothetical protein BJL95_19480 [Methylomonas sp. LWB]
MHWFESQLAELDRLAAAYSAAQRQPSDDLVSTSASLRTKRGEFIAALQTLVDGVVRIKGIHACAAYHEGLILASAGQLPHADALGALIEDSIGVARDSSAILKLGDIEQLVIVGSTSKVAVLNIGPVVLCIACPKATNLAAALSEPLKAKR